MFSDALPLTNPSRQTTQFNLSVGYDAVVSTPNSYLAYKMKFKMNLPTVGADA